MARRKITWTEHAKSEFLDVLQFYYDRNGNNRYSRKIFNGIQKTLGILSRHPFLGKMTDIDGVRVIFYKDFQLFYRVDDKFLTVLSFWDSRQDPDSLMLD
jgi:toxin YoeB